MVAMKSCSLLVILLLAAPAWAQQADAPMPSAEDLDLSLPQASSTLFNNPPGTWYGDTSGKPALAARELTIVRSRCPTSPSGEEQSVTGSLSTGIGHSSRGGTSHWNAASINYCKEQVDSEGDSRTFNLNINIDQYDGPGFHGPGIHDPRLQPMPHRVPRR